ncbi:MAG: DUF2490 domain-containing protein [Planctomycetota bacterium]
MKCKKRLFPRTTLITVILIINSNACFAFKNKDFQYWSTGSASIDLNKTWEAKFEEQFKLSNDAGNLYYHHLDLGFTHKNFMDGIDLGFNFKKVYEKDSKGKWRHENRPHLNLTAKGQLLNLDLSNRCRLEYRDREKKDDVWRYRNKFAVKFPEFTELKLKPFIAEEPFVELTRKGCNQNRLSAGFSFKLSKNVKGDLFYLWQSNRSNGGWNNANIIGTTLKLSF